MLPSASFTVRSDEVSVSPQRRANSGSMNSLEAPLSRSSVAVCPLNVPRSLNKRAGWLRTPWSSSGGSESLTVSDVGTIPSENEDEDEDANESASEDEGDGGESDPEAVEEIDEEDERDEGEEEESVESVESADSEGEGEAERERAGESARV